MQKPDLIEFKPKTLAKAEEVNYNFEKMLKYVLGTSNELQALVNSAIANMNLQLTQSVFTGKIETFAGDVDNIPLGWLLCDGSEVSREEYKNLYNKIGVKYGKGNGITTFNLPNYIDKYIVGGIEAGIVKEAAIPNITASAYLSGALINNTTGAFTASGAAVNRDDALDVPGTTTLNFNASRISSVYKNDCNTVQPPSVTALILIKT